MSLQNTSLIVLSILDKQTVFFNNYIFCNGIDICTCYDFISSAHRKKQKLETPEYAQDEDHAEDMKGNNIF